MDQNYQESEQGWLFFLDYKSAYDNMSQDIIYDNMRQMGANEEIINGMKFLEINSLITDSELGKYYLRRGGI